MQGQSGRLKSFVAGLQITALLLTLSGGWAMAQVTVDADVLEEASTAEAVVDTEVEPQAVPDIQIDVDQLAGYGSLIEQINAQPRVQKAGIVVTDDPGKWLFRLNGEPAPADGSVTDISIEHIQFISIRPDAGSDPDGGIVSIETAQESLDP